MRYTKLLTALMLLLPFVIAGCAANKEAVFDPRACPREKTYTPEQQAQIAEGLDKSPRIIQGVVVDYGRLRDQARACRGAR